MEKIVTFVGIETKSGQNDNGTWTLRKFKDAGGNYFTTFDDGLGQTGTMLMGQPIRVTWVDEPRQYTTPQGQQKTTVQHVLQTIEAAPGSTPDNSRLSGSAGATGAQGGSQGGSRGGDPQRDARIASQWALGMAHAVIDAAVKGGVAQPIADPDIYVAAAENLAGKFLESSARLVQKISGVSGGGTTSQPQSGATAGGDPTAAGGNAWTGQQY